MRTSERSLWWIVTAAIVFFSLSNIAGIATDTDATIKQKVVMSVLVTFYFVAHWYGVIWVAKKMQRCYPHRQDDQVRLIKAYSYAALFVVASMLIMDGINNQYLGRKFWTSDLHVAKNVFQGFGISILLLALTEAFYQYFKNQRAEKEKAELLRLNVTARYHNLKQQVNPHFLFNSFNTLSSLINVDPKKAEEYVEEMSLVYRYLLQSSREELTTLYRELRFLQSYLVMLQTRFGEGLEVFIDVPKVYHNCLVPPLTLQILVENAVKHNEVSLQNPLQIAITVSGAAELRVCNNLQPKSVAMPSEKIGLANIISKYRLLGQPEVIVLKTPETFIVTLPLIKTTIHEDIDRRRRVFGL